MKVQFGVHLPIHGPYDYKVFLDMVMFIDRLGFDYFTVGDHFFLPSELYVKVGGDPSKPNKMDAWTMLAAAAAKTKNVRLGTRVSPIPFYIPSRLAKIVATADIISNGRIIFGVGAGWYSEEAIAYGVGWGSHRERIERMLEGLKIILDLWSKERTTYEGKYYRVLDAPCWPKPLQKPHPPIWFGGSSKAIIRATVKYGDGIFPITDTQMSELLRIQRDLREEARRAGRADVPGVAPSLSYPNGIGKEASEWIERVESHLKLEFKNIMLDFCFSHVPIDEAKGFLEGFAQEVFPSFH